MKKQISNVLQLKKQTITELNDSQLLYVKGGTSTTRENNTKKTSSGLCTTLSSDVCNTIDPSSMLCGSLYSI